MAGYLFVHFTGEEKDGEQVYFSISKDGLFWEDLNACKPVLYSNIGEQGVRDPFLVRDEKEGKFYLIATDLRIEAGKGWGAAQEQGSRDLIIWESKDLLHWSEERSCTVGILEAGCVWAPEAVYDYEKDEFLVFFASKTKKEGEEHRKQRIYAAYTKDFREFSETFLYIEKEKDIIDTTIVQEGGVYYRFSKDETTGVIQMERSTSLLGEFQPVSSEVLEGMKGVEGPECFERPDGTWCLIVDRFAEGKGYLPLVTEELGSGKWRVLPDTEYNMGRVKKRHGGILKLTEEEYDRLHSYFQRQNPVLPGLYADPDLAVFNETFYLYPTTDGFAGWSGTAFSVFSSLDGVQFQKECQILDVASEEVPWAVGSAWAPCIAQKNGNYYFYFCAKGTDGISSIGAAVSKSPTGPFCAEKQPLLTMQMVQEAGVEMWQTIDPSIYQEGERVWLLFGNGTPAIAELSADMLQIIPGSICRLEGALDFREAITVLKREGIYHFTWSCDDTGSEDYHVNYGTSESLFGPITYQYPILEKEPERGIYATGHHSIARHSKSGEYYIAYHRFATPAQRYPEGKGYHREVCIAPLQFSEDGRMQKVRQKD